MKNIPGCNSSKKPDFQNLKLQPPVRKCECECECEKKRVSCSLAHTHTHTYLSRPRIKPNSIFEISSSLCSLSRKPCCVISSVSRRYSRIATHSNALPRAITKKFFLSLLLNLEVPSAIFNIMLKDALLS